jgi:hypothetical protein
MSIITKQKLLNAIAAHPKLVTLGIGFALTLAIGTIMSGILAVDHSHLAFAHFHHGWGNQ